MNVQHVSPMVIWATGAGIMGLMLAIISWQRKHISAKQQQRLDNEAMIASPHEMDMGSAMRAPVETSGVIVVHLKAEGDRLYQGYELLQALLSAGLRFGKHQIFHYHLPDEDEKSGERTVFSMASMQKPGTFDIDVMGGCRCPGLTFFMSLKGKVDPLRDFQLMMDAAGSLLEDLGGVMLSENRQVMSEDAYRRLVERVHLGQPSFSDA